MYNQLLISLQIEEKWYTFRLFFGILSCYYLQVFEEPKHYLYAIPTNEIALNPNLTQNPGW